MLIRLRCRATRPCYREYWIAGTLWRTDGAFFTLWLACEL